MVMRVRMMLILCEEIECAHRGTSFEGLRCGFVLLRLMTVRVCAYSNKDLLCEAQCTSGANTVEGPKMCNRDRMV